LGALNRARHFARFPGGKGINVSRVLKVLGSRTCAYALIGGDDGLVLDRLLGELKLPHRVLHVRGLTRNNYKIATAAPRAVTEINGPGPRVAPPAARRLLAQALRARPRAVALSGSLPPGLPPSCYAHLIRRVHRAGVPALLDASGEALRLGLAARPLLIKPNRHEAQELLGAGIGSVRDAARAAEALAKRGPRMVLLSLGPQGAVLADGAAGMVLYAPAPRVRVVSAVGAGDCMVAGWARAWWRTRSAVEALRLAVACGSAAAMTPGTMLCRRGDVERLMGRVRVRRLA
jgi:6-phosphofructokinase 2